MTPKLPFARVVIDHGAMVLKLCQAVLSPPAADRAWTDAFLAAMKAYPQLPDGASVPKWLLAIADDTISGDRIACRRPEHRARASGGRHSNT